MPIINPNSHLLCVLLPPLLCCHVCWMSLRMVWSNGVYCSSGLYICDWNIYKLIHMYLCPISLPSHMCSCSVHVLMALWYDFCLPICFLSYPFARISSINLHIYIFLCFFSLLITCSFSWPSHVVSVCSPICHQFVHTCCALMVYMFLPMCTSCLLYSHASALPMHLPLNVCFAHHWPINI